MFSERQAKEKCKKMQKKVEPLFRWACAKNDVNGNASPIFYNENTLSGSQ
eukprot:TRINITY_DN2906_c0_g1_i1.p2 TRINITY_DN2906_c0_g1~~TRINITY_DN2906_c0_g1_i1.p2  ORF type:complete len:50 (+),score=7.83 TRINITY_DN2906_c0_g1_i1:271-420(+)